MILALICDSDCQMKDELQVGGSRSLKSPLAFYTESGICSRTFGTSTETTEYGNWVTSICMELQHYDISSKYHMWHIVIHYRHFVMFR